MFERFTDRSRRVLVYAQEEARDLRHASIGTEHLLMGLILENDGVAAQALGALGVTVDVVREKVVELAGPNHNPSPGSPPFTDRAKKVLEFSLREALQLGHSYIGTEHLLLGLVREGDGVAVQVLSDLGVKISQLRTLVFQMMPGQSGRDLSEPHKQLQFDNASLRGLVRAVGQQLRPDLEGTDLDDRAVKIADELFNQLRQAWTEPDASP
jgi:ATP-dependent Clp protease ATP-binding subunit ClpC